ncbi:MAG: metal ABC transporter permease [Bacteriovoracaceae bacterium]|jgi:ABC-type Mn2+/Zn2+ transport system permease subunit|nr:metal ABC transporter permease [Bacteriovoracaceae bacterium]
MIDFFLTLKDFIEYEFLQLALVGTILVAICSGILSPFVVSKRLAFIGSALSHSTLLGVAIGFCLFSTEQIFNLYLTTLLITLIIVAILAKYTYRETLPADSMIGIFLTTSMGLGILVYTLFAKEKVDLMSYLFGNILLISSIDIIILFILTLFTGFIIFNYFSTWVHINFDEESARISGINTKFYHHLFYFLMGIVITSSIKIAGTVLVNTFLLVPGTLALKLSNDLKTMMKISVLFSIATAVFGLILANGLDLPLGATMASFQFFLFIILIKIKS